MDFIERYLCSSSSCRAAAVMQIDNSAVWPNFTPDYDQVFVDVVLFQWCFIAFHLFSHVFTSDYTVQGTNYKCQPSTVKREPSAVKQLYKMIQWKSHNIADDTVVVAI